MTAHEHSGGGRVEEGQLDRVSDRRGGSGDRVVDDVDAVRDGLIDGGDQVDRATDGGAVLLLPQGLIDGDPRGRGDPGDGAVGRAVDARLSLAAEGSVEEAVTAGA